MERQYTFKPRPKNTKKKSALSNAISEMWDELNRTKCTSGGMVWSDCCQTLKADPTGSRVDPQAQNRTYTTWQMFLITFFKQTKSYSRLYLSYSLYSHEIPLKDPPWIPNPSSKQLALDNLSNSWTWLTTIYLSPSPSPGVSTAPDSLLCPPSHWLIQGNGR